MTKIEDQPAPKPSDHTPAWELVIADLNDMRNARAQDASVPNIELVLADAAERDRVGRERYGVPLQAGNGRNHLIDAYQELLDFVVYLRAEIDERGIDLNGSLDLAEVDGQLVVVYYAQLQTLCGLRGWIK